MYVYCVTHFHLCMRVLKIGFRPDYCNAQCLVSMHEYSAVNNSRSSVIFRTKCLWSDILSGQDVTLKNASSLVKGMNYRVNIQATVQVVKKFHFVIEIQIYYDIFTSTI